MKRFAIAALSILSIPAHAQTIVDGSGRGWDHQELVAAWFRIIVAASARNEHEKNKNPDVLDGKIFHGLVFITTSLKPSCFRTQFNEFIICNG